MEVPFDVATGKAVVASLTGASTYAVGHLFRHHFAQQGTFAELDVEASRSVYRGLLERGKNVVGTLRPSRERSVEATATLLERLARLRDEEVIDAAQFESLKGAVLSRA